MPSGNEKYASRRRSAITGNEDPPPAVPAREGVSYRSAARCAGFVRAEAGRSEAAGAARARLQVRAHRPGDAGVCGHHHLRNAAAALDDEGLVAVVDQDDADLAAVVGIDGPRRIQHRDAVLEGEAGARARSEEHTSELQSLMRISYAVFCLKKKKKNKPTTM